MKKIFGKNQVIITALAIMIAVSGYLSITQDKADEAANLASEEVLADDVLYDISDEDVSNIEGYELSDTGEIITPEPVQSASPDQSEVAGETAGAVATEPVAESGTDMAQTEETSENIGEAVLVSSTIGSEYFASAKLSREQTRSKNKEILMEIINSATATDIQKEEAVEEVIGITSDSEKENAAETMLEAKGFGESIVNIVEDSVDVIVNANDLTEKDIAQIEDIVKRKTNADASNIVITPVGVTNEN